VNSDKITIICWTKRDGEAVRKGDPIGELGTDKATVTLEAWDNGVLRLFARPGDTVSAIDEFVKIERPSDLRP
jgi:pyruvate/2-oxoglutarate dehydrogenase complex dihydrolipoamide acyltransferase (E2) component